MYIYLLHNLSQSNCCVSVVKDFNKLKRYNIHSIVEDSSKVAKNISEVSKTLDDKKDCSCVMSSKDAVDTHNSCEETSRDSVGNAPSASQPTCSIKEAEARETQ